MSTHDVAVGAGEATVGGSVGAAGNVQAGGAVAPAAAETAARAPVAPAPSPGTAAFTDQNQYFTLHYPVEWEVTERKETVGVTIQAPQAEGEWRARIKINVRTCPRSQTLDRTMYLVRNDMLQIPGVKFTGQATGDHPSGKPAGMLRWITRHGQTELAVEQWFVLVSAGVVVQYTASAAVASHGRYQGQFKVMLASLRPLPPLTTRVLLNPGRAKDGKPTGAEGNGSARTGAPAPASASASAPQAPSAVPPPPPPRVATRGAAPTPKPVALNVPGASTAAPVTKAVTVSSIAAVESKASAPGLAAPLAVAPPAPASAPGAAERLPMPDGDAEVVPASELMLELSGELSGEVAAPAGPTEAARAARPETPLAPPAAGADAKETAEAIAAERVAAEKVATKPVEAQPVAQAESGPSADDADASEAEPEVVDLKAAFTRVWVYVDLTAKALVGEMRQAGRRSGVRPGNKALFEGRVYLCDVLRRLLAQAPESADPRGIELSKFIQKKITWRASRLQGEYTQRLAAYAKAEPAAVGGDLEESVLAILADYLSSRDEVAASVSGEGEEGEDHRGQFLAAAAELDARLVGDFRRRLAALLGRGPEAWWVLSPAKIDAELGNG